MQRDPDRQKILCIREVIEETPTVRTLVFEDDVLSGVLPGQFAMVWVPGVGELPMSVMIAKPGMAAFTVRRHGTASTGLYNMGVGEKIGVRGPYGNSFDIRHGKILLVGGGTGTVPLMRLLTCMDNTDDITVMIGARTRQEVFFEELAEKLLEKNPHKVVIATEDGSYGVRGLVTDKLDLMGLDAVYTCGPEPMMYKIVQAANSRDIFVQASIERVMKCGVGMCGSCCMGRDLVCFDGTVFDGAHLASNPEFGHIYRDKAGRLQDY